MPSATGSTQTDLPQRLDSIQTLRGIAVMLVVAFHIGGFQTRMLTQHGMGDHDVELLSGFWNQGFAGVDLFFVISGFIMVYVTRNTPSGVVSAIDFLKSRITRIYPLWWIFAALMAVYFWVSLGVPANTTQEPPVGQVAPHLIKSFLLLPQHVMPVLVTGWSLVHEMWFYLVFAGIICLPRRWLLRAVIGWAGLVALACLAGLTYPNTVNIFYLATSPLTFEFLAGCLAAWLLIHRKPVAPVLFLAIGIMAFSAALGLYQIQDERAVYWQRVIVFGLPSAAIVYGVVGLELKDRIKTPRWLTHLGDWSYALYLSHIFVLSAFIRIFYWLSQKLPAPIAKLFDVGAPGIVDNLFHSIIALTAIIILSYLTYKWVERPLIKGTRKLLG